MPENRREKIIAKEPAASFINETPSRLDGIVFFLLCATLVLTVIAFGAVDVWALGGSVILVGLIIVFWTADAVYRRSFRLNVNALLIPLAGLFVVGLIQLLPLGNFNLPADLLAAPTVSALSFAPYATRLAVVQLFVYIVFFAAAQTFINSPKRLRKIVLIIILFGAAMAFFGILQRLSNSNSIYGVRFPNQAFPFGSFVNQHHFAAFMEMTLGLTLGLLFGKATKSNKRIFLLAAVVVMGAALVFTSSRGGMISLLVVVGFIVINNLRLKSDDDAAADAGVLRRNAFYIGGGLLLILTLFTAVLLLGGDASLLRGVGFANQADASNGRFHFWSVALRIFLDHPILGTGLDSFGTIFPQYDDWNGMYRVEQAHNDYLQILADAGFFGFVCIAAFIFLVFKKSRTVVSRVSDRYGRGAATGALAGICGILVHSFFDFPLRTPSNTLFFLTLTVIATALLSPQNPARRKRLTRPENN